VDVNHDGIIDICEFIRMMSLQQNPMVTPEVNMVETFTEGSENQKLNVPIFSVYLDQEKSVFNRLLFISLTKFKL